MSFFSPSHAKFAPSVCDSAEEAEHYDDFIARGNDEAQEDQQQQPAEKPKKKVRFEDENRPVRVFDPTPFLQDGKVELYFCDTNGMQSLVNPLLGKKARFDSVVVEVYGESRALKATKKKKKAKTPWAVDQADGDVEDMDLAYGIYFGPDSNLNRARTIPTSPWPDKHSAYLHGTIHALKMITKLLHPRYVPDIKTDMKQPSWNRMMKLARNLHLARENTKLVIIKSDSKFMAYCLRKNIWTWLEKGFENWKGVERPGTPLLREIHGLMVVLEGRGVQVQFWGGVEYEGKDVKELAKKALDERAELRTDFGGKW